MCSSRKIASATLPDPFKRLLAEADGTRQTAAQVSAESNNDRYQIPICLPLRRQPMLADANRICRRATAAVSIRRALRQVPSRRACSRPHQA